MQDDVIAQVAHGPQRLVVEQCRADHRKQLEIGPVLEPAIRPIAVAVQDMDVDLRAMMRDGSLDGASVRRMSAIAGGFADTRQQPEGKQRGHARDRQVAGRRRPGDCAVADAMLSNAAEMVGNSSAPCAESFTR